MAARVMLMCLVSFVVSAHRFVHILFIGVFLRCFFSGLRWRVLRERYQIVLGFISVEYATSIVVHPRFECCQKCQTCKWSAIVLCFLTTTMWCIFQAVAVLFVHLNSITSDPLVNELGVLFNGCALLLPFVTFMYIETDWYKRNPRHRNILTD